jgi:hypothetical protein
MRRIEPITMKYLLLFVTYLFCCYNVIAQEAPNLSNNTPGSAEVTAVAKSGSIPVNYFSGIPGISVPIFNYTKSGISANVSLDYFAGGVRVLEEATNTGLGWHINAGGVIARNLRGLPDDCPGRGFIYTPGVNIGIPSGKYIFFDNVVVSTFAAVSSTVAVIG